VACTGWESTGGEELWGRLQVWVETGTQAGRDGSFRLTPGWCVGACPGGLLPLTPGPDTGLLACSPADGFACCLANGSGMSQNGEVREPENNFYKEGLVTLSGKWKKT